MSNRKSKKALICAVAAVAVIATAGTAIAVSAAPAEPEGRVLLNLSESQENAQAEGSASGYILTDVSDIVDEALPSVVSITSRTLVDYFDDFSYYGGEFDDIFDYFFGDSFGSRGGRNYRSETPDEYYYEDATEDEQSGEPEEIDAGMGSGTIIGENDTELLILTSYHVVSGSSSLYVTFNDGANVDGYIKSADADKDIAVVAIPKEDIEQETLDSIKIATICTEEPDVGDGCIVIGNALGYGISVTTGIISALNREVYIEGETMNLIQTDAAVNNGNSGGCMLNSKGEVIGINEAKITLSFVEGMCYAIPVYENLDLIEDLMNAEGEFDPNAAGNNYQYADPGNAFLGINGRDVSEELSQEFGMPKGVYVYSALEGGGAADAGVMSGDIITGIDGEEVSSFEGLQYQLSLHKPGDVVTLSISRLVDGAYTDISLDVTLTERFG